MHPFSGDSKRSVKNSRQHNSRRYLYKIPFPGGKKICARENRKAGYFIESPIFFL